MQTIEIFEQLDLFDEFKMQELENVDYFEVVEQSIFLNQQIEKLIRRNFENGENYYVIMAGQLGLWSGNRFGHSEFDIDNFSVFLENYYTDVYIGEDGALNFAYLHHDGIHQMNLYLVESEAYEMNPYHMEDYLYDKEPISVDEKFLKAFGFTSEQYNVIK